MTITTDHKARLCLVASSWSLLSHRFYKHLFSSLPDNRKPLNSGFYTIGALFGHLDKEHYVKGHQDYNNENVWLTQTSWTPSFNLVASIVEVLKLQTTRSPLPPIYNTHITIKSMFIYSFRYAIAPVQLCCPMSCSVWESFRTVYLWSGLCVRHTTWICYTKPDQRIFCRINIIASVFALYLTSI